MKVILIFLFVITSHNVWGQFAQQNNSILVSYGNTGGDGFHAVFEWGLSYNKFINDKLLLAATYSNASSTRNLDGEGDFDILSEDQVVLASNDTERPTLNFYNYKSIGLQIGYKINASTRSSLFLKTGTRFLSRHSVESMVTTSSTQPIIVNRNSDNSFGVELALDYRYKLNRIVELGGQAYYIFAADHRGGNIFIAVSF